MLNKKRNTFLAIVVLLSLGIFLFVFCGNRISGQELIDYIPTGNVTKIVVQKVLDDGVTIEDFGSFELDDSEIELFYTNLSSSTLKDIGEHSFTINNDVRYFVYLSNSSGYIEGTMKFYDDEILIFDYVYGDRPALHKRYSITSSTLIDFFNSIILLKSE